MQNDMRDRLVELLQEYTDNNNGGGSNHGCADHLIANDVVYVVRCKDCKHRQDRLYCRRVKGHPYIVTNTDFCSYGERKEDNGKL